MAHSGPELEKFQFIITWPLLLLAFSKVVTGARPQKTAHGQEPKGNRVPFQDHSKSSKIPHQSQFLRDPSPLGMAWVKDHDSISTWTFEGHLSKHSSHILFLPVWKNNVCAVIRYMVIICEFTFKQIFCS